MTLGKGAGGAAPTLLLPPPPASAEKGLLRRLHPLPACGCGWVSMQFRVGGGEGDSESTTRGATTGEQRACRRKQ